MAVTPSSPVRRRGRSTGLRRRDGALGARQARGSCRGRGAESAYAWMCDSLPAKSGGRDLRRGEPVASTSADRIHRRGRRPMRLQSRCGIVPSAARVGPAPADAQVRASGWRLGLAAPTGGSRAADRWLDGSSRARRGRATSHAERRTVPAADGARGSAVRAKTWCSRRASARVEARGDRRCRGAASTSASARPATAAPARRLEPPGSVGCQSGGRRPPIACGSRPRSAERSARAGSSAAACA